MEVFMNIIERLTALYESIYAEAQLNNFETIHAEWAVELLKVIEQLKK